MKKSVALVWKATTHMVLPTQDLKTWNVTNRISAGAGPDGLAWVP